jgi:hypothetical protein
MRLTHDHDPLNDARPSTSHTALAEPEPSTRNGSSTVAVTSNPIGTPPRSDRQSRIAGRSRRRSWRLVVAELAVLAVVLVAAAPLAHAAGPQIAGNIDEVLSNIRNWLMGVLAGLATIFFSVGGVRYLMAGGDPGEVEKAKTAWKAAGIGYCGAALAPLIVAILQGLVA